MKKLIFILKVKKELTDFIARVLDVTLSLLGLFFALPILSVITVLAFFDTGSPIFRQKRMGRNKKPFTLVKFRTMSLETGSVASHLVNITSITRLGRFLRKTKLDELPQLWNVLMGDMSLVGPRPNLFNQYELIKERGSRGVYQVRPGITGLAQVSDIDMSTPALLAMNDAEMISTMSIANYFKYIFLTISGKGFGDTVRR